MKPNKKREQDSRLTNPHGAFSAELSYNYNHSTFSKVRSLRGVSYARTSAKNMTRYLLFIILPLLVSCENKLAEQADEIEITQEEYNKLLAEQIKISSLRYATLDSEDRKMTPNLKDFLAIYPESIIRYLSFAETDFPGLSANTTLYDRYKLNMRIPVRYSDDHTKVLSYGLPICYLLEIRSVDSRDDGLGGTELGGYSGGDLQKHFGDAEWQKLFKANGDFSVLGYELKQDKPVKNFKLVIQDLKNLEHKTK
jgi:hypothetical protein